MGFVDFWLTALWESLSFAWVSLGALSVILPILSWLITKFSPQLAANSWIKKIHENHVLGSLRLTAILFALYVIYAPYSLYSKRDEEAKKVEQEYTELQKDTDAKTPDLRLFIKGQSDGTCEFLNEKRSEYILVFLEVTNHGEPTTVKGWPLLFKFKNKDYKIFPTLMENNLTFPAIGENAVEYTPDDQIFNKLGTSPLPKGAIVEGVLFYKMPSDVTCDGLIDGKTQLSIRCWDYNEKSSFGKFTLERSGTPTESLGFPGIGKAVFLNSSTGG